MKYELNESQIDTILRGLDALEEAAESESRCTSDEDILASNAGTVESVGEMRSYLENYEEAPWTRCNAELNERISAIIDSFEALKRMAKKLGLPIRLVADERSELVLYFHDDYPDMILVDKSESMPSEKYITSGGNTFEVVGHVPLGYTIWNIGKNMVDGYLPFCRLKQVQPFDGGREIETDTLKAIKCDGAQVILSAIGYGPETPKEMERFIEKAKTAKVGSHNWRAAELMSEALPFMRQLRWDGDR